jgi:hypothetical protein
MSRRTSAGRLLLGVLAAAAFASPSSAEARHEPTFWTGYMSSWWVDESWALWFDTHYNTDSFFVARGGVTRAFRSGPSVTGGYAFLLINPDLERQEHRAWAQVVTPYRFNDRWRFSLRTRLDFRFQQSLSQGLIVDGWDFTFRPRFQFAFTRSLPGIRWGEPFVQLADEVLVNLGSTDVPVGLDQNRVSLMFGLDFGDVTVRVGYMNRYIPSRSGRDTFEHGLTLWFTHSVDLGRGQQEQVPEAGGS